MSILHRRKKEKQGAAEQIRKEKQGPTYGGKRRWPRAAREAFGSLAGNDKEKMKKKVHENENGSYLVNIFLNFF